ncbi:hypothetical protein EJ04DRAFT_514510 [Polyplosphaeria fusca]|uniref:Secreted protein n=1 Tax=Polyplosphaeria fusca TaxID=682080 RepID=A0A9P4QQ05_9PLEO|nr:hypothetical protein EJ04DRAFT_514510 [Polyplosphaeria fusca]
MYITRRSFFLSHLWFTSHLQCGKTVQWALVTNDQRLCLTGNFQHTDHPQVLAIVRLQDYYDDGLPSCIKVKTRKHVFRTAS